MRPRETGTVRSHRVLRVRLPVLLALAAVPAGLAAGQLPSPRLSGLAPSGGRPGETLKIVTRGDDLDEPQAILFSHPGITGSLEAPDVPAWNRPPESPFRVTIAPGVPPGRYEARVSGRFGLSTAWPFFVGDLPVVQEQPGNDTPDKAMRIEPDTVVEGDLGGGPSPNVDYYRFAGTPGQRLVLSCEARPLNGLADLMVQVTDPEGRLLATAFPSPMREPVLLLSIRAVGDHLIRVNDRGFADVRMPRGRYRLTLGTRPHVVGVWPPVASTTVSGTHRLIGYLLPGGRPLGAGGREELDVVIPAARPVTRRSGEAFPLAGLSLFGIDAFPYRLDSPRGPSNAVPIAVAGAAPLVEEEPNGRSAARPLPLPADVVGRFDAADDQDWFRVDAAAGTRVFVEVMAERLGAAADVSLVVEQVSRDPQGVETVRTVATQDDQPPRFSHPPCDFASADPALAFTAEPDASYRIGVRNRDGGSYAETGAMYRLLVRPAAADFRLLATLGELAGNARENGDDLLNMPAIPRLRRGSRIPLLVQVHRHDGFDGPVTVGVEGLPPGVTARPVTIAGGVGEAALILEADAAAAWRGPIRVTGTAWVGAEPRTRQAEWAAPTWTRRTGQPPLPARLVDEMPLEVRAEPAPLRIAVAQADCGPVPQGGTVKIPFTVEAAAEMQGGVRVEARELPAAKPGPPYAKTPAKSLQPGEKAGEIEIVIPADTPPGTHAIHLVAKASLLQARNPEALAAATKAQADSALLLLPLQAAAAAAEHAAEAAEAAAQAAAALPAGPQKQQAQADAAAVRQAAEQARKRAKAALDAQLRGHKALEAFVARVQKANEPKPTDVFAASTPISLTVTVPEPAAAPEAARIGPLLPLLVQAAATLAVAEERPAVDFGRDVLPILRANCIPCHAGKDAEAGVVLETPETMQRPRDEGLTLVPGKAAESLLYLLAAHAREPVMPPEDNDRGARRLSADELAILKAWIDAGAAGSVAAARPIVWQAMPPGVRWIDATAVSPDGRLAAAGIANRITLFDVATRAPVARLVDADLPQPAGGGPRAAAHLDAVRALAFSPDGTQLASGAMRSVTIWKRSDDGPGGEPVWRPERRIGSVEQAEPFVSRVPALAFSPDGKLLAAGGGEPTVSGDVAIIAVDTGAVVRRIAVPQGDSVACLAFSPDGTLLATGANRVVGIYAVATGERIQEFDEHGGRVLAVDWKRDGTALVSVGADGKAYVWRAGPWEKIEALALAGGAAVGVRYHGATDTFVVAEGDGRIRVRGVGLTGPQPEFAGQVESVQCLAADAGVSVLAAGGKDGVLRVWAAAGGEPVLLADPGP